MWKFINRMLAVAVAAFIITACGSGGASAGGSLTQAQFDTFLQSSDLYKNLITANANLTAANAALTTRVTADEALLKRAVNIGHQPGTSILTATTDSEGAKTMAFIRTIHNAVVQSVSFGLCPDMGSLYGFGSPNAATSSIVYVKQCSGYIYPVNTGVTDSNGNNPVADADILWYDGPNCTGNIIQFEGQNYNHTILQMGLVYMSPVDSTTELMVTAGQTPTNRTSASAFVGGGAGCTADVETHLGYPVTVNVFNTTSIPAAVPAGFVF